MIAKKENLSYTESNLTSKTTSELKAICDGLEITYDADETDDELKALILA